MKTALIIPLHKQSQYWPKMLIAIEKLTVRPFCVYVMMVVEKYRLHKYIPVKDIQKRELKFPSLFFELIFKRYFSLILFVMLWDLKNDILCEFNRRSNPLSIFRHVLKL